MEFKNHLFPGFCQTYTVLPHSTCDREEPVGPLKVHLPEAFWYSETRLPRIRLECFSL